LTAGGRRNSMPMFQTTAASTKAPPMKVSVAGLSAKKIQTHGGAIGISAVLSKAACADGRRRAPMV
jgi:hypothetical protein